MESTQTFPRQNGCRMTNFNGLTFAVVPVVTGAGALNTSALPAGTYIAGILDPTMTQRIFDPQAEGNPVVSGTDAYSVWLPTLKVAPTAATVTDNYWAPVFAANNEAAFTANAPAVGLVTLQLTSAAKNTVEASSVMTFRVSPRALIITATAGTF